MKELDEYGEKLMAIDDRVYGRIGEGVVVEFSAYKLDDDDNPIDNLDQVPIEGKVMFTRPRSSWVTTPYNSRVLTSPTWLDICEIANEMIKLTDDHHHVFLEAVNIVSTTEINGEVVQVASFSMGS